MGKSETSSRAQTRREKGTNVSVAEIFKVTSFRHVADYKSELVVRIDADVTNKAFGETEIIVYRDFFGGAWNVKVYVRGVLVEDYNQDQTALRAVRLLDALLSGVESAVAQDSRDGLCKANQKKRKV